ncbi:uncharacterized protein LOC132173081 [Corylus avellana]|uniref:uncharacterized protein LOC132173081 n=1 Tax=Corylus avellana TaxID=13451 RepID=UPI00286AC036|nr:uncharacterized protein LOC132173081 [Corylus avellana]
MGNGQSIRVRRTPFRYHRISPSNSLNQPLLDDDSQSMLPNLQLEAHQKQKAALEKENRDLRSALSRLESKLQSKATEAQGRNTSLEREVNELKSQVSKLKSERQVLDKAHKFATEAQGRNTSLEREVNELKSQVSKLKSERQLDKAHKFKQEEAIEKLKRSNTALEDKVKKQSVTTISEMKTASSDSHAQVLSVAVVPQIETATWEKDDVEIASTENDIAACLVVLILLVSILIGISL